MSNETIQNNRVVKVNCTVLQPLQLFLQYKIIIIQSFNNIQKPVINKNIIRSFESLWFLDNKY